MGRCGQSLVLSCTWSTSKTYAQTHTHTHTHIRTNSPPWDAVGSPWCCHVHGPPQKTAVAKTGGVVAGEAAHVGEAVAERLLKGGARVVVAVAERLLKGGARVVVAVAGRL